MTAKTQGFSKKRCLGKLSGKKERNGSETLSVTGAREHEHKGRRLAKEFLKRSGLQDYEVEDDLLLEVYCDHPTAK